MRSRWSGVLVAGSTSSSASSSSSSTVGGFWTGPSCGGGKGLGCCFMPNPLYNVGGWMGRGMELIGAGCRYVGFETALL